MDFGSKRKLINDDTRFNLLGNQLVLIAPKDSKLDRVAIGPNLDLAKLAGDGSIAVGDVREVPVGEYAKAALEKLGAWQAAAPKLEMQYIPTQRSPWLHVEKRRLASSTLLMLMVPGTVTI